MSAITDVAAVEPDDREDPEQLTDREQAELDGAKEMTAAWLEDGMPYLRDEVLDVVSDVGGYPRWAVEQAIDLLDDDMQVRVWQAQHQPSGHVREYVQVRVIVDEDEGKKA